MYLLRSRASLLPRELHFDNPRSKGALLVNANYGESSWTRKQPDTQAEIRKYKPKINKIKINCRLLDKGDALHFKSLIYLNFQSQEF